MGNEHPLFAHNYIEKVKVSEKYQAYTRSCPSGKIIGDPPPGPVFLKSVNCPTGKKPEITGVHEVGMLFCSHSHLSCEEEKVLSI